MVKIRYADVNEKRKIYEWLCLSDITHMCMGEPDYPEHPIPSWEDFREDFVDSYFLKDGRESLGAVMIIENDGSEVGTNCYTTYHLQPHTAELDTWMKSSIHCGKGYGSEALKELINHLHQDFNINRFIIRPSEKNAQAIKAYEKAGFKRASDKEKIIKEYYLPEYINIFGGGDYGPEQTATLTLEIYE